MADSGKGDFDTAVSSRFDGSNVSLSIKGGGQKNQVFIRYPILALAVIIWVGLMVGVGLLVHYTNKKELKCLYPESISVAAASNSLNQNQTVEEKHMLNSCVESLRAGGVCVDKPPCGSTSAATITTTFTTIRPTTPKPPPKNIRITHDLMPSHYVVELQPYFYADFTDEFYADGSVRIDFQCKVATSKIIIHSLGLTLKNETIRLTSADQSTAPPKITEYTWDEETEFLTFNLGSGLVKDASYSLFMEFTAPITDGRGKLSYVEYQMNGEKHYMIQVLPREYYGRAVFPCFDEPGFRATMDVTLVRKTHMQTISMSRIKTMADPRSGDFVADIYETTPKITTRNMVFFILELAHAEIVTESGIRIRGWDLPVHMNKMTNALNVAAKSIEFYAEYYDFEYPSTKLDLLSLPNNAGAGYDDHWFVTLFPYYSIREDVTQVPITYYMYGFLLTVHNVGHMWIGQTVAPEWKDDLWIREGLAWHNLYQVYEEHYPAWDMKDWRIDELNRVFRRDATTDTHALVRERVTWEDVRYSGETVDWHKSVAVFRMAENLLGANQFRDVQRDFVRTYKYKPFNHDDMWKLYSKQESFDGQHYDFTELMRGWMYNKNYPIVRMIRVGELSNTMKITQTRFAEDRGVLEDEGAVVSEHGWKIPLRWTSSTNKDFDGHRIVWLQVNETQKSIYLPMIPSSDEKDEWVLGNVESYAYLRVQYDDDNWRALTKTLKTDHTLIPPISRAMLVSDAFEFMRVGMLNASIVLDLVQYMKEEDDWAPWIAFKHGYVHLNRMFASTAYHNALQDFWQAILLEPLRRTNFEIRVHDHSETRLLTEDLLEMACHLELQECVDKAMEVYNNWKDHGTQIEPDFKKAALCTAVRHGSWPVWEYVYQKYREAKNRTNEADYPFEIEFLWDALSCSKETWLQQRHFHSCMKNEDVERCASSVQDITNLGHSSYLAWDFARDNWEDLNDDHGGIIQKIAESMNSPHELAELQRFLDKNSEEESGRFRIALKTVKMNIRFMENNRDEVARWLKENNYYI